MWQSYGNVEASPPKPISVSGIVREVIKGHCANGHGERRRTQIRHLRRSLHACWAMPCKSVAQSRTWSSMPSRLPSEKKGTVTVSLRSKGFLCRSSRRRHRRRDSSGPVESNFRSLFHDQTGQERHRPRPLHHQESRRRPQRFDQSGEHFRSRNCFHNSASAADDGIASFRIGRSLSPAFAARFNLSARVRLVFLRRAIRLSSRSNFFDQDGRRAVRVVEQLATAQTSAAARELWLGRRNSSDAPRKSIGFFNLRARISRELFRAWKKAIRHGSLAPSQPVLDVFEKYRECQRKISEAKRGFMSISTRSSTKLVRRFFDRLEKFCRLTLFLGKPECAIV